VIRDAPGLESYIRGLAKDMSTRGFDVPVTIDAEVDQAGSVAFSIVGLLPDPDASLPAEMRIAEIWKPLPNGRWQRAEYTYDLIDRPLRRRRAYHLHDADHARSVLGVAAHEHCEEILGEPTCDHYRGIELASGHEGIELLDAAWVHSDELGCSSMVCVDID
jgi:hypothetical protein